MASDVMSEDQMRALLQVASADPPVDVDLLSGIRAAGTSDRQLRKPLLPALAWLGAAAAGGVAVVVVAGILGVGNAPSAQAQVAAAVAATTSESFRVHITQDNGAVYDGLSDPARGVGVSTESDGSEWRYVGDTVYAKKTGASLPEGKLWVARTRPSAQEQELFPSEALLIKIAPDDPQGALQRLRAKAAFTESGSASGDGWMGKQYTFTLAATEGTANTKESRGVNGLIAVDDQGRVRQVTFTIAAGPGTGSGDSLHEVMTFSDYGIAVHITVPPASQVVTDTSDVSPAIGKRSADQSSTAKTARLASAAASGSR